MGTNGDRGWRRVRAKALGRDALKQACQMFIDAAGIPSCLHQSLLAGGAAITSVWSHLKVLTNCSIILEVFDGQAWVS